jgi:DnaJ like chaperone protein
MGHVAKSDGRVSEREIAAAWRMMRALHLNDDQTQEAMECFRDGKQPGFTIATGLRELREALHSQPQLAHFFIELQLQAALLGNGLGPQPRSRVQSAAHFLGLEPPQFAQIEAMVRWQQQAQAEQGGSRAAPGAASDAAAARAAAERQAEAYRLLEASVKESDEQIVKAYRRQMSKHHPDKLQSKGLPEAWIERAKERTQQIQAAYELVRTARGMQ